MSFSSNFYPSQVLNEVCATEAGLISWNFLVYIFRGLGTVLVVVILYLILGHAIMIPNSIAV